MIDPGLSKPSSKQGLHPSYPRKREHSLATLLLLFQTKPASLGFGLSKDVRCFLPAA